MRGLLLAAAALLVGCGAAAPGWPADAGERAWTVPLVVGWHPSRVLIEVRIDGGAPQLMTLDTRHRTGRLRADVVQALDLPRVGDPTRGRRVRASRVQLGDLTLTDVTFEVSDAPPTALFGRPVVGALGTDWLEGRRLIVDRERAVLTVPAIAEPLPAYGVEMASTGDAWAIPVELAGVSLELVVALGHAGGWLTEDAVRQVAAALDGGEVDERITVGSASSRPGPWRLRDDGGRDGGFALPTAPGWSFALDLVRRRFAAWAAGDGAKRFARFGPMPGCPDGVVECVVGRVEEAVSGRVTLAFEAPLTPLPARFGFLVDLGVEGRPYAVLAQLRPGPPGDGAALTATVDDPALTPDRVRAPGQRLTVLDIVPVDRPCRGTVCLQRQVGDAAEGIVESSAR